MTYYFINKIKYTKIVFVGCKKKEKIFNELYKKETK